MAKMQYDMIEAAEATDRAYQRARHDDGIDDAGRAQSQTSRPQRSFCISSLALHT